MSDSTPHPERWLPVVGWEGLYEVSDLGRIRSLSRTTVNKLGVTRRLHGRVLKPFENRDTGHSQLGLHRDGVMTLVRVHLVVLEAFVGPRPDGLEACHGPTGGFDNRLANLRWDTHSANMRDRTRDGTCHHIKRTHCNLGHRLVPPNITNWYAKRGLRRCLACHRARSNRYYARKHGESFDLRVAADRHYVQIMAQCGGPG